MLGVSLIRAAFPRLGGSGISPLHAFPLGSVFLSHCAWIAPPRDGSGSLGDRSGPVPTGAEPTRFGSDEALGLGIDRKIVAESTEKIVIRVRRSSRARLQPYNIYLRTS